MKSKKFFKFLLSFKLISLMKYLLFFILLRLKRIKIVFLNILKTIQYSLIWIIGSNEHTSFSLKLSENNLKQAIFQLSYFSNLNIEKINEKLDFMESLEFKKKENGYYNLKTIDVDYINKFDYRFIPFVLFFEFDINYLFEFGFNQGRLPFYIDRYLSINKIANKKYFGIDYNIRKGGLIEHIDNPDQIQVDYLDLKRYLLHSKESINLINESMVLSTTHEKESENFLFKYLEENNIFPKVIISDNVLDDSSYIKFINFNNKLYKSSIFVFNDKYNFIDPIYIGLAIKL